MTARLKRFWLAFTYGTKEYLLYDARWLHRTIAPVLYCCGLLLLRTGYPRHGLAILCRLHRSDYSSWVDRNVEMRLHKGLGEHDGITSSVREGLRDYMARQPLSDAPNPALLNPHLALGKNLMVLASATDSERGVLAVQYSFYFPVLGRLFDMPRVLERYHLVVEPSWSGFCDQNILSLCELPGTVFVATGEPRDRAFVEALAANLVPVDVTANWWVDHEVMRPATDLEHQFDICMVAGWGHFKRHFQFFSALKRARESGHRWRVALVGYPQDTTMETIKGYACLHGVDDQLTWFENISQHEVSEVLAASRCFVLWSRREGVSRAIIEAMLADLPVILRRGFNYGAEYPHLNQKTGRFATEAGLPATIQDVIGNRASFAPREWIVTNRTCEHAAERIADTIRVSLQGTSETFTAQVAIKVSALDTMVYRKPFTAEQFADDYAYLRTCIQPGRSAHGP